MLTLFAAAVVAAAPAADDRAVVSALDVEYQAAVKANDPVTIARIQAPDMVLVVGRGDVYPGQTIIDQARDKAIAWEIQDEIPGTQTVRLYGDTAVVTAKLHLRYTTKDGELRDRKLWFSDTYVRRPEGWRYVFGQSSLALEPGS